MPPSRQHLTAFEKTQLRQHYKDHPRLSQIDLQAWVAAKFSKQVGRSTVGKVIKSPFDEAANETQMKRRPPTYAEIEPELIAYVHSVQSTGLLSDEILRVKANKLAGAEDAISPSWVQRFKKRHGISLHVLHGEAASVDTSMLSRQRTQLMDLLDTYSPRDIFNMDETALFFRLFPSQSLATRNLPGRKKDKTRITVGLCSNVDGSEKLPPIVINRFERPRSFKGVDVSKLKIDFFANKKAWMTGDIFANWLRKINLRMHGRKILLLVDNAPGHVSVELSNVRLHSLPTNTTALLQPMDAGVIRNFKLHYKKKIVQWLVDQPNLVVKLDLTTAVKFVVEAWSTVTPSTVRHCWSHTRIMSASMSAALESSSEPKRHADIVELNQLISQLELADVMDAEGYISVDDALVEDEDYVEAPEEDSFAEDEHEDARFSYQEALIAAQKLQVYMFSVGVESSTIQKAISVSTNMMFSTRKQTKITDHFLSK